MDFESKLVELNEQKDNLERQIKQLQEQMQQIQIQAQQNTQQIQIQMSVLNDERNQIIGQIKMVEELKVNGQAQAE